MDEFNIVKMYGTNYHVEMDIPEDITDSFPCNFFAVYFILSSSGIKSGRLKERLKGVRMLRY
jgi:hypothetical protein